MESGDGEHIGGEEKEEGVEGSGEEDNPTPSIGEDCEDKDIIEEWVDSEEDEVEDGEEQDNLPPPYIHRDRNPHPLLPSTVQELSIAEETFDDVLGTDEETADFKEALTGGKVYVVGTAHFSVESQDDVGQAISETQPDVVMVELCAGRVGVLSLDEETLLKEAGNITMEKMMATIKQVGLVQGIMNILLLSMSANITKQLGMAPGGEFRKALQEARAVRGCRVELGDRPVEVTLQRAIGSLNWWRKLRLVWYILLSHSQKISKEDVERCKERDILEELLKDLAGEYPELSKIFVQERDQYMAQKLKLLLLRATLIKRRCWTPETPWEPAIVVGVVGMGHLPGIVDNWQNEIDMEELMRLPPKSRWGRLIKWGLLGAVVGASATGLYLGARTIRGLYHYVT